MQSGAGAVFLLAVRGATRASGSVTRCIDGLWLSERRYLILSWCIDHLGLSERRYFLLSWCIDRLWLSERRYFLLSRNVPQMMSLEWSKVRGVNAHLNPANTFKIFIQLGSILAVVVFW